MRNWLQSGEANSSRASSLAGPDVPIRVRLFDFKSASSACIASYSGLLRQVWCQSTSDDEPELAPSTFEEGGQATVDDLKQLNLGTEDDPRPIFISALLKPQEEGEYFKLLLEYKDVFAWSYKEMPGLDPKVAVHHLTVKHGTRPIKQPQ